MSVIERGPEEGFRDRERGGVVGSWSPAAYSPRGFVGRDS